MKKGSGCRAVMGGVRPAYKHKVGLLCAENVGLCAWSGIISESKVGLCVWSGIISVSVITLVSIFVLC